MEFKIILNVSAEELFKCLNYYIIEDVKTFTGKLISDQDIKKGFKYQKDINLNSKHPNWAKVEILDYLSPQFYTIRYESNKKKTIVNYNVNKIGTNQIELNYKEDIFVYQKEQNEFIEINHDVKKIPFIKKIQFRSLVKDIKKRRYL